MPNREPTLIDSGPAFEQAGLLHRVARPQGAGPHPTVVMLHGRSGNEDVMWVFARTIPPDWLVVAPRAIEADPAGGYSWHPRQPDEWPTLAMFSEAVAAVAHFLDTLPDLYDADPAQLYLSGFSQGAATAYAVAMEQPERIQGIAGLVGFMPGENGAVVAKRPLRDLPIFMAVGREDETIPLDISHQCATDLIAAGAYLTYREYDTGHKLNSPGIRDLKGWWQRQADK